MHVAWKWLVANARCSVMGIDTAVGGVLVLPHSDLHSVFNINMCMIRLIQSVLGCRRLVIGQQVTETLTMQTQLQRYMYVKVGVLHAPGVCDPRVLYRLKMLWLLCTDSRRFCFVRYYLNSQTYLQRGHCLRPCCVEAKVEQGTHILL